MVLADATVLTIDGGALITAAGTVGSLVAGAIGLAARAILAAMRQRAESDVKLESDRREFEVNLMTRVTEAIVRFDGMDVAARQQNSALNGELLKIAQQIATVLTQTVENLRTLQAQVDGLAKENHAHGRGNARGRE